MAEPLLLLALPTCSGRFKSHGFHKFHQSGCMIKNESSRDTPVSHPGGHSAVSIPGAQVTRVFSCPRQGPRLAPGSMKAHLGCPPLLPPNPVPSLLDTRQAEVPWGGSELVFLGSTLPFWGATFSIWWHLEAAGVMENPALGSDRHRVES